MRRSSARWSLVFGSVIALLMGVVPNVSATPWANDTGFIPYGTTSYLQTPLPANAPVATDQATFLSWEKANEPVNYWKLRGVANAAGIFNPYGENFGVGQCTDPIFKLESTATVPNGQSFLITMGFHAPRAVFEHMAGNNDNPVVLQDACGSSTNPARVNGFTVWAANVLYDGTNVLKTSPGTGGNLTGGSFAWNTNGLDSSAVGTNAAAGVNKVSRGRIPDSMFVRDYSLTHPKTDGTIGYRPEVFFMETNSSAGFQTPMIKAESGQAGCGGAAHTGICAEGQIVRIDPAKVFPSTCTGPALVLAKTLQLYGGYLGDNSGSGSGIKLEQGSTVLKQDSLSACMTLDDLRILQKGYVPPHS